MDGVMLTGKRTNGPASLKVSYSLMVPPPMRGQVREVSAILCDQASRNKGHAKALMADVMADADRNRITLLVVVEPFEDKPLDADALRAWYERLGFVEIQSAPCVMARAPKVIQ